MIIDLIPYNPLEDSGHAYSSFKRVVLDQIHELNVAQDEHHNCTTRIFLVTKLAK